jgi:hypothetical protein
MWTTYRITKKKKFLTWNYATFSQAELPGPTTHHYRPHYHYDQ